MDSHFQTKPSGPLYHYTTLKGFLSICNDKEIWATNIYYLNDSEEFKHAEKLLMNEIRARVGQHPTAAEEVFLDRIRSRIDTLWYFNTYILSLTEKPDQLSQWRGYCPDGNGLCFCIDVSQLMGGMPQDSCDLVKCIYERSDQEETIKKYLDESLETVCTMQGSEVRPAERIRIIEVADEAARRLTDIFPRMKDKSFDEEKEWRIVLRVADQDQDKKVFYREGKSTIIPYTKIRLSDNLSEIADIVVGPTPHGVLSKKALKEFLHGKGNHCHIDLSPIPYRPWI